MINTQALIGMMLGSCTLQKLVGQGEMSAVFLAQQSHSHRQVAVKVLLPEIALTSIQWSSFLERFHKEISAVSSFKHENILPVYEYGEQNGLAYVVMPYVSGETLRLIMEREGPLALPRIVTYLDQLAGALDFAHKQGILHEGIRPGGIMLAPERSLLLTDFGMAKILAEKEKLQIRLLKSAAPVEALKYMAPEQVRGDDVGVHADVYALGVILYQMVTGKTPFQGETAIQVATQLIQVSPPSPRLLRVDLPVAAEQVILRALAKRPADRYGRAQYLAKAFRVALTATGIQLDSSSNGKTANNASSSAHLSAPRPGSLFDPVWQKKEGDDQSKSKPTSVLPASEMLTPPATTVAFQAANTNIHSKNRTTNLLSSMRKTPLQPLAETPLSEDKQMAKKPAAHLPIERNTPLPPSRPRLGAKTGLLRPMDEAERPTSGSTTNNGNTPVPSGEPPFSPAKPAATTSMLPNPVSPFPATNVTRTLPTQQSDQGNSETTEALSAPKRAIPNPVSPFPGAFTTGALMVPSSEEGKTGTIKLTGAVKVVQVPVAGQPGRYVTGLLPMSPPASSTRQLEESLLTTKILTKWKEIKKQQKIAAALALCMLLVLVGGTGLFFYTRPGPTTKNGVQFEHITPNLRAIMAARATATTAANTILIDPLSQNIHNWPIATTGYRIYVFENGAYHIIDNDANKSAPAILPGEYLKGALAYTLTMQEIKGDDSSVNNSFGMILRFNSQTRGGEDVVTFYSFEVVNKMGGEYQFWKYDNSGGSAANPWTAIWQQPFGDEFHQGEGSRSINTFKILASGKYFSFTVNGKKVGTAEDSSLAGGQVGMLVNLMGTEVAFSDLELTYT